MTGDLVDDVEFLALPDEVQEATAEWASAIREADQRGAGVLSVARNSGVAKPGCRAARPPLPGPVREARRSIHTAVADRCPNRSIWNSTASEDTLASGS